MAEDHEVPEAVKLPRVWTRGRKKTESCQRVSEWRQRGQATKVSLEEVEGNMSG